jgi:hypothetical protein
MFILDAIDPTIFLISLSLGLLFAYLTAKTPRIIYKYPTPYNNEKIVYTDSVGNCYKYRVKEMSCPRDIKKITPIEFK